MRHSSAAKRHRFLVQLTLAAVDDQGGRDLEALRLVRPQGTVTVLCPLTAVCWHALAHLYTVPHSREAAQALALPRGMARAIQTAADDPGCIRVAWWRRQLEAAMGVHPITHADQHA
jgi:hypothetical protein